MGETPLCLNEAEGNKIAVPRVVGHSDNGTPNTSAGLPKVQEIWF
jgi:hypothetical protein